MAPKVDRVRAPEDRSEALVGLLTDIFYRRNINTTERAFLPGLSRFKAQIAALVIGTEHRIPDDRLETPEGQTVMRACATAVDLGILYANHCGPHDANKFPTDVFTTAFIDKLRCSRYEDALGDMGIQIHDSEIFLQALKESNGAAARVVLAGSLPGGLSGDDAVKTAAELMKGLELRLFATATCLRLLELGSTTTASAAMPILESLTRQNGNNFARGFAVLIEKALNRHDARRRRESTSPEDIEFLGHGVNNRRLTPIIRSEPN